MTGLGGPPPKVGDKLVTGYACFGMARVVEVMAVYVSPAEWAALCRTGGGGRFEAVDNIAFHVGLWRAFDRFDEKPSESDAAQREQQKRWGFTP